MSCTLLAVWLSLALQPCAMAGIQAMESAPCSGCPEQHSMSQAPCQDAVSCASMDNQRVTDDAAVFSRSLSTSAQPALISWAHAYAAPAPLPYRVAINVSITPVDLPPLSRFCILQI